MIVIENIEGIVGFTAYGRQIESVKVDVDYYHHKDLYIFTFPAILDGCNWNEMHEVRLYRNKNERGKYELFVMGLYTMTVRELTIGDIRNELSFITEMGKCLKSAKEWYIKHTKI